MSHRVVGGVVVGACGVVGPAHRVAVGLEPGAVAGAELGESTSIGSCSYLQLFGWVHWWGTAKSTLLGAWDRTISPIIRSRRSRLARGIITKCGLPGRHQRWQEGRWVRHLLCALSRPLMVWWNEAWRVALRGRGGGGWRLGDWSAWAGGRLCKTVANSVLGTPSGGGPQSRHLRWDTAVRSLLMAAGRDLQSLVLDHLKFVKVCWGHLGEPEGGVVFRVESLRTNKNIQTNRR